MWWSAARRCATVCALATAVGLCAVASAQDAEPGTAAPEALPPGVEAEPYEGRVVGEVAFEGLERVTERFARNQIRTSEGRPLEWETIRADLRRLERLGEFQRVEADVVVRPDGTLVVVYRVEEAPIIQDIVVVGNRQIADQDIAREINQRVSLIPGVPIDEYRIGQAQRAIEDLYRAKGFYQVEVTADRSELEESGIVLFRVREGERTQVTGVRFSGNESIPAKQIRPSVETKERFLLFNAPLDNDVLDDDVAAIVQLYRNRGFLDVRASREITLSPNAREAIVTFVIDEGPQYVLRRVIVEGPGGEGWVDAERVIGEDQIRAWLPMKPGDVYEENVAQASVRAVVDGYNKIGYVDVAVRRQDLRAIDEARVDMRLRITEGERFRTGLVVIQGNTLTQSKVIRRRVDLRPGQWLDGSAAEQTERELAASGLFEVNPAFGDPPEVTIQPEDPANPGYRDVLVEVQETNTGSLSFGAAVNSDAGLVGTIRLTQRNFDIADVPDSWSEFFRGRAFRGAGQTFNLAIQPGTEVSTYALTIADPALFETPYGLSVSGFFRDREFSDFDERRWGGSARLARRFGTRWTGGFRVRMESVELSDIDSNAPVDVFEVEDQNFIDSIGFDLQRTTVDNRFRPTEGTRTEFVVLRYGIFTGDFEFTRLNVEHSAFLTIDEDDFGRETVLQLRLASGLIPEDDEAPVYERIYLGGRNFRGFDFRGIGPVGIRNDTGEPGDDHVGGEFSFFAGAEVERPVWQDILAVVGFVDTGTLNNAVSLANYRVSVGTGIRLYLPQFGQAPLAFDFAFPLVKEDTDDEQFFSFSVDLPF